MVCLAENYDDLFFTKDLDTKMESLVDTIKKFPRVLSSRKVEFRLNLDLIIERENGYTVLWLA